MQITKQPWILSNKWHDISYFYLPAIVVLLLFGILNFDFSSAILLNVLVMATIDAGHAYSTILRIYFNKAEFTSNRRTYLLSPFLIWGFVTIWAQLKIPYLWSFFAYNTLFHYIRQNFGVLRWYEKINNRTCLTSHRFLYGICLLSILAAHFRPGMVPGHFSKFDYLLYPSETFFSLFRLLYFTGLVFWIIFEINLFKKGIREPNRFLAIAFPVIFNSICMLYGNGWFQIVLPIVTAHGFTYFGLMTLALHKTQPQFYKTQLHAIYFIIVVAILGGLGDWYFDQELVEPDYLRASGYSWLNSGLLALMITPTLCHYLYDAWIWKGNHREAPLIYS